MAKATLATAAKIFVVPQRRRRVNDLGLSKWWWGRGGGCDWQTCCLTSIYLFLCITVWDHCMAFALDERHAQLTRQKRQWTDKGQETTESQRCTKRRQQQQQQGVQNVNQPEGVRASGSAWLLLTVPGESMEQEPPTGVIPVHIPPSLLPHAVLLHVHIAYCLCPIALHAARCTAKAGKILRASCAWKILLIFAANCCAQVKQFRNKAKECKKDRDNWCTYWSQK